jgi:hypothetical protein
MPAPKKVNIETPSTNVHKEYQILYAEHHLDSLG